MNHSIHETQECIEVCNTLLQGEISAVETYAHAIEKFWNEPGTDTLVKIRHEHSDSVKRLQINVKSMGGEPATTSGAWGTFSKVVQDTANLFGEGSSLQSLKQGEEFGVGQYETALSNEAVMPSCKELIRSRLLPALHRHINTLNALKKY